MAWMGTRKEEQRRTFVDAVRRGQWSVSELCERYGISRTTGHKWLRRYVADGFEQGLRERSRAPKTCPHRTPRAVEEAVLALRARYGWGAANLAAVLATQQPTLPRLARSTVNAILALHGKLRRNRRRARWQHPGAG